MDNIELWKQIDSFSNYQISNMGRVKIVDTDTIMKNWLGGDYYSITLHANGIKKNFRIHTLVAQSFITNPKPELYSKVDHINSNKLDNRSSNLRWVDQSLNMKSHHDNFRQYIGREI